MYIIKKNYRIVPENIVTTSAISYEFSRWEISQMVDRHLKGDWGDQCESDKKINEDVLKSGDLYQLLSVFKYHNKKIYVITNYETTTVLFPEEY